MKPVTAHLAALLCKMIAEQTPRHNERYVWLSTLPGIIAGLSARELLYILASGIAVLKATVGRLLLLGLLYLFNGLEAERL